MAAFTKNSKPQLHLNAAVVAAAFERGCELTRRPLVLSKSMRTRLCKFVVLDAAGVRLAYSCEGFACAVSDTCAYFVQGSP